MPNAKQVLAAVGKFVLFGIVFFNLSKVIDAGRGRSGFEVCCLPCLAV